MRAAVSVFALTVFAAVAAPAPSLAADGTGNFSIRGVGAYTCKTYLEATPAQKQFGETWWAGYLTAMNRTTDDTYDVLGSWTVKQANAWLVAYCTNNPGDRFAFAVHKMLEAAYPTRRKTGSQ